MITTMLTKFTSLLSTKSMPKMQTLQPTKQPKPYCLRIWGMMFLFVSLLMLLSMQAMAGNVTPQIVAGGSHT
ncbi:MAG: hypothetical protein R8L53_09490, partial [Mariprofundales bacterium]